MFSVEKIMMCFHLANNCFVLIGSVTGPSSAVTCLTADPDVASFIPAPSHTFARLVMKSFLQPFSSRPLKQEGLSSVTSESMCTKYWLTAKSSLQRKLTVPTRP